MKRLFSLTANSSQRADPKIPRSRLFDEIIIKSWWVVLFFILSYFIFDSAMRNKNRQERSLHLKLEQLNRQIALGHLKHEELLAEIESQKDPEWIELTLRRCLGLCPKGAKKVHFVRVKKTAQPLQQ